MKKIEILDFYILKETSMGRKLYVHDEFMCEVMPMFNIKIQAEFPVNQYWFESDNDSVDLLLEDIKNIVLN